MKTLFCEQGTKITKIGKSYPVIDETETYWKIKADYNKTAKVCKRGLSLFGGGVRGEGRFNDDIHDYSSFEVGFYDKGTYLLWLVEADSPMQAQAMINNNLKRQVEFDLIKGVKVEVGA